MRMGRLMTGAVTGLAVAALLATVFPTNDALAKRRKKGRGGKLRLIDVNVGAREGVEHNDVFEFKFTTDVDASSVGHAIFRIRGENATRTGFTKQVPGSFQVQGRTVRFYPRLPTHLRDPDDPRGGFYPLGTERDNADENAGLQPLTNYEIQVMGHPTGSPVRSKKGRPLDRTYTTQFTTAAIADRSAAFTIDTYADAPPPRFRFSNPPDKVASANDLYAKHGGTEGVPSDIAITLFGTKVPLAPSTMRKEGSVQLIQTERYSDPTLRKPVSGAPFIEQNFDTTRMFFVPDFPLPDVGVFALRVSNAVKDLTGLYDFQNNIERTRVRDIYEFLDTARRLSPSTPCEQLQDPPAYLIYDWPADPAERGVLKCNLLDLGDTYPDELDPRVMVLFSTRDEPISTGRLVLEFVSSDGYNDVERSTASYDNNVPGAAAAIMTIAGGSAADGDFLPVANETIDTDDYPANTVNWRRLVIPPGVTVSIKGSRPAIIRALEVDIQGELFADGEQGANAPTSGSYYTSPKTVLGGDGGPGGGKGGDGADYFSTSGNWARANGDDGVPGHDVNGIVALPEDGGRGGQGGLAAQNSSAYHNGGGGGGGGARLAGTAGANATSSNGWNGKGGAGGAGSDNADLDPLVGGAGGGAAAHGSYQSSGWGNHGGAGGGGGGALRIQTSAIFGVGPEGVIGARGGRGGVGKAYSAASGGPGGGGGGGSLLLQSSAGFDFGDETSNTDVRGGFGATQSAGSYGSATFGGTGGLGYVRVEDPNGGYALPGGTTGTFDPIGGGVASYIWTLWIDVGVDGPRILNFTDEDFDLTAGDDAILIEMQMAIEDPENFGEPKLDAVDPDGNSGDTDEVSNWTPVRIIDNTGGDEPAIPGIPGYNPVINGKDYIFDIADDMNGKNYKFVRYRITFQLNETQSSQDPLPYIDRMQMTFEFNF